jgi:acid stress-induced BolA-like protein IbaG/YrbA
MPMPAEDIIALIQEGLPGAEVEMIDLAGDNDHWKAIVTWEGFDGLSILAQQKRVYAALGAHMGTTLHALQLETQIRR